jgi:nucleoside-diphosphate-sugar epimerase
MGQKILVTGGKGMIGLAISEIIRTDSWDIKDNLDIRRFHECDEVFDGIIHLAAKSRVVDGYFSPYETWETNTIGTLKVLEKARNDGSWVINGSSLTAGSSQNVYSYSKLASEQLCMIYSHNYDVKCISVRFSTVYGHVADLPNRFIPSVASRLLRGETELVLEDQNANLSPTFISDVAKIIVDFTNEDKNEWNGEVYPIVSKEGFLTTSKMVDIMCEIADRNPRLIWGKSRFWDRRNTSSCESKIKTETTFRDGFTIYYEKLREKTGTEVGNH